jgi:hypothetical protein
MIQGEWKIYSGRWAIAADESFLNYPVSPDTTAPHIQSEGGGAKLKRDAL